MARAAEMMLEVYPNPLPGQGNSIHQIPPRQLHAWGLSTFLFSLPPSEIVEKYPKITSAAPADPVRRSKPGEVGARFAPASRVTGEGSDIPQVKLNILAQKGILQARYSFAGSH